MWNLWCCLSFCTIFFEYCSWIKSNNSQLNFYNLFFKIQAGQYSNGTACLECPKGHYCPSSSSSPIPCQSGTYADTISSTSCLLCPAGSACVDASSSPVSCSVGTYSVAGQIKCSVCFYCPYMILLNSTATV